MCAVERVIRYVDLEHAQSEQLAIGVCVEDGHPVEPMRIESPAWLAISHVPESAVGERFILYFLAENGRPIDFAERKTLNEAMDEVLAVVSRSQWKSCSVPLAREDGWIPRQSLVELSDAADASS